VHSLLRVAAAAVLLVPFAGCMPGFQLIHREDVDWLLELLDPPEGRIEVGERSIVILPFTTSEILNRFPDAEREIGAAVTAHLHGRRPDIRFVRAATVYEWKARTAGWQSMPTPEIGKALKADIVIEVHVTEFRVRGRSDRNVLQGVLTAEVKVTDVSDGKSLWRLGKATFREPRHPVTTFDATAEAIRVKTMARFATEFANVFYHRFE